jgi:DNA-binding MarR family transcriptional regulator
LRTTFDVLNSSTMVSKTLSPCVRAESAVYLQMIPKSARTILFRAQRALVKSFDKSHILEMDNLVIKFLGDQPVVKILRGLMTPSGPRHIRDFAAQYSLSLSGVSDILRRFTEAGIVREYQDKNKRCFELILGEEEAECLKNFFSLYQTAYIEERAKKFSENAAKKFQWMDEAYVDSRKLRKRGR